MDYQQTFQCPICDKPILIQNKEIHLATCEKHRHNYQQQTSSPQRDNLYQLQSFQANYNSSPQSKTNFMNSRTNSNNIVSCSNCNMKIQESELAEHQRSMCQDQIPCEFCGQPIALNFFTMHEEQCSKNPQNIGTSMENIQIPCEICGRTFSGNLYEKHVEECAREAQRHQQEQQQQQQQHQTYEDIRQRHFPPNDQNQTNINFTQPQNPFAHMSQQQNDPFMNIMTSYGNHQFSGFPQNPNPQQINPGSFPQGVNQTQMQTRITQSQQPNGRMRTVTTLPNGSVIIQEQSVSGPVSVNHGRNMMGPQGIRVSYGQGQNEMGNMGSIGNFLNVVFGSNFGRFGPQDLEQLMELLQVSQGLDKETLDSFTVVKYDKEKSKNLEPELKKCSICLEEFDDGEDVKFLLCLHRFHKDCIDPWMEKHTTCPICKKDYSNIEDEAHE